jgi:hypothetical protein
MATESELSIGDLDGADRLSEQWTTAPQHAEEPHIALSRPILVATLRGELRRAAAMSVRFADGWEHAGRPGASNLAVGAAAGAAANDLTGNPGQATRLRAMVSALAHQPRSERLRFSQFDALVLLHTGDPEAALARLEAPPEADPTWFNSLWRPWYAALWAEAGVLTGTDPRDRLDRARAITAENPVATALVDRAQALLDGGDLAGIAQRLEAAGAAYQAARTRVMAGGALAARGAAALEHAGILPMGWNADGLALIRPR